MLNSLAYSDKSIVKNLRTESSPRGQKAGRAARQPTPLGYGNSVTTFHPRGSLGSKEVFAKDLSKNETGGHRFLVVFSKNFLRRTLSRTLTNQL